MTRATRISFLGPLGTYSDVAAHRFAQRIPGVERAEFQECRVFSNVFDNVEQGASDFGVIALENSLEGPVTAALDDFVSHQDIDIIGEEVLDIHHSLLVKQGTSGEQITAIASHPQGLAQCRRFLAQRYPHCEQMALGSTAEAARCASHNPEIAAIASDKTAELYNLDIVERNVEDVDSDQTSFVLIAPKGTATLPGPHEKTSLLLFLQENRAGALLMVLQEFAYAGLNLTKIQSRPTKQSLGDYLFFLDVEASLDNPDLQVALECLRLKMREVRVLGSYPILH